jgi:hypothetical protein
MALGQEPLKEFERTAPYISRAAPVWMTPVTKVGRWAERWAETKAE